MRTLSTLSPWCCLTSLPQRATASTPPRIWTRCSRRHLHVTSVPTQINESTYYKFHNIYKYVDKHITLHTWNCSSQFLAGPPTFPRGCGWSGPAALTRCTGAKRASRSSSHVRGTTRGPTAGPTSGRPSKYATSCRVGAISPQGRWNVCVSGLHLSTSADRRTYRAETSSWHLRRG